MKKDNLPEGFIASSDALAILGGTRQRLHQLFTSGRFPSARKYEKHWIVSRQEVLDHKAKPLPTAAKRKEAASPVARRRKIDGETYVSLTEAAERMGRTRGAVVAALKTGDYPRAREVQGRWYLRSVDIRKPFSKRNEAENYVSVTVAAQQSGRTYAVIYNALQRGDYPRTREVRGRTYIHKRDINKPFAAPRPHPKRALKESCSTTKTRETHVVHPEKQVHEFDGVQYLLLKDFAQLRNQPPAYVEAKRKNGDYPCAREEQGCWYIPVDCLPPETVAWVPKPVVKKTGMKKPRTEIRLIFEPLPPLPE